jgi:hypothetical protein
MRVSHTAFTPKREHLTRIMSTGMNVPGQTAPHQASSIDTDVYWHTLGRAQQSVKPHENSLQKRPRFDSAFLQEN